MANYIFQKISKEGRTEGLNSNSEEARDWFRDKAMSMSRVNSKSLMSGQEKVMQNDLTVDDIGSMYMFFYDPKWKDKLPYYDRFPLIFMMNKYSDGFLGMNLHYLPPTYRARLMDALYDISTERNDKKRIKMSYSLLNSSGRFSYFRPTVKRYLNKHIRSRFRYIPSNEWDIALMLPTERFVKASKQNVWNESKNIIRNR